MSLKQIQAMIFDLDGTLFQTEELGSLAFERAFNKLHAQGIMFLEEELNLLHAGIGQLFPGVRGTLSYFQNRGIRLYIRMVENFMSKSCGT